jgi:hypothetical protein
MRKILLPTMTLLLLFTGLAWGQAIQPGDYEMDWSVLHRPVSSDQPTLETGTDPIRLESSAGTGLCPPTSAYVVRHAPASSAMGGTTTWCIKSDGAFDGSAGVFAGAWQQYTSTVAIIEVDQGSRANDTVMAVARFQTAPPPPPPSPIKVFITSPKNGATVTGTVWVTIWAEGTTGSANVFTLSVDGKQVGTTNAGSSRGPVTMPWNTTGVAKGTHTIRADVRDASGNTGTTSISIILQ